MTDSGFPHPLPWPGTPRGVVEEALREYVGDGDGMAQLILAAYDGEVAERARAEITEVFEIVDSNRERVIDAVYLNEDDATRDAEPLNTDVLPNVYSIRGVLVASPGGEE